jgi:hypothetical protein
MKKEEKNDEKKKYEKPVVTRYPLRPEEAVLGFCKSNASAGPSNDSCLISQCFSFGS